MTEKMFKPGDLVKSKYTVTSGAGEVPAGTVMLVVNTIDTIDSYVVVCKPIDNAKYGSARPAYFTHQLLSEWAQW